MPQDTLLSDATLVRDASSHDNRVSDASSQDTLARDVAQYTLVLDAIRAKTLTKLRYGQTVTCCDCPMDLLPTKGCTLKCLET